MSMRDEQVVLTPRVAMTSLMQAGMPVSGPALPAAIVASAAAAAAMAASSVTVT